MRRRDFVGLIGGLVAGCPLATSAQSPGHPIIGFLDVRSPGTIGGRLTALQRGLREEGFVEGDNVTVLYRWAEGQFGRLPELAAELVRRQVALIISGGGALPANAAKTATATIPIVFAVPEDPVRLGLVTSLARPGGNLTGVNFFTSELVAKRLELLRELVPSGLRIALLVNPSNVANTEITVRDAQAAGRAMGMQIQVFHAGNSREIDAVFAAMAADRPDALFAAGDSFFLTRRSQLSNLAVRHAFPATFAQRDFTEIGGLMSYGLDIMDAYRQVGSYAGRILKGAKPADLPVMQSNKFSLVINNQTAKIIGVSVPQSLLARADEVIE